MSHSSLYVISADPAGPVKLGFSEQPERRVLQLQTGHAYRLQIYHCEPVPATEVRRLESALHNDLRLHRLHGEWFDLSVADAIRHVQLALIEHATTELSAL
jgi:Meiotically up-regulated gene 113